LDLNLCLEASAQLVYFEKMQLLVFFLKFSLLNMACLDAKETKNCFVRNEVTKKEMAEKFGIEVVIINSNQNTCKFTSLY
jgi:hypothetical protein